MKLSKLKHLQYNMNYFEMNYKHFNASHEDTNYPFTLKSQWNKSLKPLKHQTFTLQPQVIPTWLNQFSDETSKTPFTIIMVQTRSTTNRNRQASITNPDTTVNQ